MKLYDFIEWLGDLPGEYADYTVIFSGDGFAFPDYAIDHMDEEIYIGVTYETEEG